MNAQRCPLCGAGSAADQPPACACPKAAPEIPANPVFGQVAPPGQSVGPVAQDDLRLFEGPVIGGSSARTPERPGAAGRRRRAPARRRPWLLAGTAVVGVGTAAVIAMASGVFSSGAGPSEAVSSVDDPAMPVPTGSTSARTEGPATENGGATNPTRSADPSSTVSGTTSSAASASTSASVSAKSPTATASEPPPTASSAARQEPGARVLSTGSHGGQVKDLQRRLTQLHLYTEPADGRYSTDVADAVHRYQVARGIDEDPGVYGPETRAALESETRRG
ncbi:peptidoglycan-binding domain-containing protein [Streptomyces sp. NPDC005480]|uniref:peptidoglycan-binding domain-containing protein n=1 Tax=Streptomyces sp. NPDC005480 TaxID=3154880 RepID=UPI0033A5ABA0